MKTVAAILVLTVFAGFVLFYSKPDMLGALASGYLARAALNLRKVPA